MQLRKIGFLIVQKKKTDFLLFRNYERTKVHNTILPIFAINKPKQVQCFSTRFLNKLIGIDRIGL